MFLRYVEARLNQNKRDEAYRNYVMDAIQNISENVSKFTGGQYILPRQGQQTIKPKSEIEKPQTAEQIASNMWQRMIKKGR
jgi:hypothetical protein